MELAPLQKKKDIFKCNLTAFRSKLGYIDLLFPGNALDLMMLFLTYIYVTKTPRKEAFQLRSYTTFKLLEEICLSTSSITF
jgi:hypothetical protein